jgi:predicted phage terminase large subunit-like protein
VFVPAKLEDNPHLDRGAYVQSLSELDPITRAQLLQGDWSVRQGGSIFRREWFKVLDCPPSDLRRVRFWDLAATEPKPGTDPDWTAGVLMGRGAAGTYYVLDVRRARSTPQGVERLVRDTAVADGRGVEVRMEQEPGSSGLALVQRYAMLLAGWTFHGERSTGPKVTRASPFSSQAEAGRVFLVRAAWNGPFLDELEGFPAVGHDDQVDASAGAFNRLARAADWDEGELALPGAGAPNRFVRPTGPREAW